MLPCTGEFHINVSKVVNYKYCQPVNLLVFYAVFADPALEAGLESIVRVCLCEIISCPLIGQKSGASYEVSKLHKT